MKELEIILLIVGLSLTVLIVIYGGYVSDKELKDKYKRRERAISQSKKIN